MTKKITILCSRLDLPGGIERAIVNTANLFQSKGHNVSLLVVDETRETFYPLDPSVKIYALPLHFGITERGNPVQKKLALVQHIFRLRKMLRQLQPGVVIGTEYQLSIAAYFAAARSRAKVYAWEHHHFHWLERSRFWQWLFRRVYPKLAAVVCLNPTEKRLFEGMGCTTAVIPNFISKEERTAHERKTLLTVGWLIRRKGIDMVPAIAEKVFQRYPDWRWVLIGTGPEEAGLRAAINQRGLAQNIVIVPPSSPNLQARYQEASLYVMTSRFECFPMVLLEAMAHGIPCVSFDCQSGPAYIIRQGRDGLLVKENDTEAMAEAIIGLIESEEKRKAFGAAAYAAIERFSPAAVYQDWESLFAQ